MLGGEGLAGDTRILDDGTGAFSELALGNVNLGGRVVGGRAVDSVEMTVVGLVLDVDVGVGVGVGVRRLGREAGGRKGRSAMSREEEVREKWGHACRSDNNKAIGFSGGPWLLVAKLRGWGGWAHVRVRVVGGWTVLHALAQQDNTKTTKTTGATYRSRASWRASNCAGGGWRKRVSSWMCTSSRCCTGGGRRRSSS